MFPYLVKTEQSYQKGLTWMVKWKKELMKQSLCTEKEAELIFWNIEDLTNISDAFLDLVQKRFESWDRNSTIGDVFQQITPYFKLYITYWNNNEKAGEVFREKYK